MVCKFSPVLRARVLTLVVRAVMTFGQEVGRVQPSLQAPGTNQGQLFQVELVWVRPLSD